MDSLKGKERDEHDLEILRHNEQMDDDHDDDDDHDESIVGRPRIRVRGTFHRGRWVDDLVIELPGPGDNKDDHTVTLTVEEKRCLLEGQVVRKTSSQAPGGLRKGHTHDVRIRMKRFQRRA